MTTNAIIAAKVFGHEVVMGTSAYDRFGGHFYANATRWYPTKKVPKNFQICHPESRIKSGPRSHKKMPKYLENDKLMRILIRNLGIDVWYMHETDSWCAFKGSSECTHKSMIKASWGCIIKICTAKSITFTEKVKYECPTDSDGKLY